MIQHSPETAATPSYTQVFKTNGVPDYTFVEPSRWSTLLSNLGTPGRGLVIEGPSGIGKTTAVKKALAQLGRADTAQILSARRKNDVDLIELLPEMEEFGVVVVDDFHRLEDELRGQLADLVKVLADEEDEASKLVIVGINRAGDTLIKHASDVGNRLDVIRMEAELSPKIDEMISKGEAALNISIQARNGIIDGAHGSFSLAQLLCNEACAEANISTTTKETTEVLIPYPTVRRRVVDREKARFDTIFTNFARGNKFRPGGRAPYLQILRWLQDANSWTISLDEEMRRHPTSRASVNVVLKNGYLANLLETPNIASVIHLDSLTNILGIEDPQAAFYLRNLDLAEFAKRIGFRKIDFQTSYDVALSFAGEDRSFAQALNDQLEDRGLTVFYDLTEQARILGEDLEKFFRPIYGADADFVVAILGRQYGTKRWTRFESESFSDRFDQGHVIPVWSTDVPEVAWDTTHKRGGATFDPNGGMVDQASDIADIIAEKVTGSR